MKRIPLKSPRLWACSGLAFLLAAAALSWWRMPPKYGGRTLLQWMETMPALSGQNERAEAESHTNVVAFLRLGDRIVEPLAELMRRDARQLELALQRFHQSSWIWVMLRKLSPNRLGLAPPQGHTESQRALELRVA